MLKMLTNNKYPKFTNFLFHLLKIWFYLATIESFTIGFRRAINYFFIWFESHWGITADEYLLYYFMDIFFHNPQMGAGFLLTVYWFIFETSQSLILLLLLFIAGYFCQFLTTYFGIDTTAVLCRISEDFMSVVRRLDEILDGTLYDIHMFLTFGVEGAPLAAIVIDEQCPDICGLYEDPEDHLVFWFIINPDMTSRFELSISMIIILAASVIIIVYYNTFYTILNELDKK